MHIGAWQEYRLYQVISNAQKLAIENEKQAKLIEKQKHEIAIWKEEQNKVNKEQARLYFPTLFQQTSNAINDGSTSSQIKDRQSSSLNSTLTKTQSNSIGKLPKIVKKKRGSRGSKTSSADAHKTAMKHFEQIRAAWMVNEPTNTSNSSSSTIDDSMKSIPGSKSNISDIYLVNPEPRLITHGVTNSMSSKFPPLSSNLGHASSVSDKKSEPRVRPTTPSFSSLDREADDLINWTNSIDFQDDICDSI
jgi:hypothetical protein